MVICGRIIYGLGGETALLVVTAVVSKYFFKKKMGFGLAILYSVGRVGSGFNSIFTPLIASVFDSVFIAFTTGLLCTFLTLLSSILLLFIPLNKLVKSTSNTE